MPKLGGENARRRAKSRRRTEPRGVSIAHKTGKRVGFDTATRMASDAIFAYSHLEPSASPAQTPISELDPLDELSRLVSDDTRRGYCIQFLGPGSDQTQTVLAEVEVRASDVSTAMREAAHTPWPPRAIGFRLVVMTGARSLEDKKAVAPPEGLVQKNTCTTGRHCRCPHAGTSRQASWPADRDVMSAAAWAWTRQGRARTGRARAP